jgi:hypothetical protein
MQKARKSDGPTLALTPFRAKGFSPRMTICSNDSGLINGACQRQDYPKIDATLRPQLERKGIPFTDPKAEEFREALKQGGYYADWRKQYGPEAWAALEKYSGPLG